MGSPTRNGQMSSGLPQESSEAVKTRRWENLNIFEINIQFLCLKHALLCSELNSPEELLAYLVRIQSALTTTFAELTSWLCMINGPTPWVLVYSTADLGKHASQISFPSSGRKCCCSCFISLAEWMKPPTENGEMKASNFSSLVFKEAQRTHKKELLCI